MRKLFFALALLSFNPLAHATFIQGGALYEDGSTFDFIWDDSREGFNGKPYQLLTFTHGTYRSSSVNGGIFLIESPTDIGNVFGDSLEDTWDVAAIDFPADDYHFTPEFFTSAGNNIDGWRPRNSGSYRSEAVRSYLLVNVAEPGSLSLLLAGVAGFLIRRKTIIKPL